MPRLSVVVPAYNNADFIADTMRSILDQDYEDFELIVADHASTDATWQVLEGFAGDPRVTLLHTSAGGGAQANWQRVTEAATGELIKLVCGDDVVYTGLLRTQVEAFDRHPSAVLVANSRDILDASGAPLVKNRGITGAEGLVDGPTVVRRSITAGTNLLGEPACVMMRREEFLAVGGWDGTASYLIDQASYSRLLLTGPMVGIRRAGAGFRVNAGQWSVALAAEQSKQAAEFHRQMHEQRPDLVSLFDVIVGNVRAAITALMRRAVYVVFARRLRSPAKPADNESTR